ncbi:long-chain fatty acid--CoA ligase [Streptomyces sp. NPDC057363]|uniref:long-chain fatty acid--CoA ligase n=1 Tax=Streptomyces sp. NPDC057363 TaxID=3346107 RepID=UPI0036295654
MKSTMGFGPLTLAHVLRHGATWHAGREVVTVQDGTRQRATFAEVGATAARLAHGLRRLGITGDERVGTLLWNTRTHLETYLAVPAMGAVLHSANLRLSPDQLAYTINAAQDRVLIVAAEAVDQLVAVLPLLTTVRTVVVDGAIPPHLRDLGLDVLSYEDLVVQGEEEFPWPEVDENSAAALCFTTGTTGDPKGVAYSHRSILLQCLAAATTNALRIGADDRVLMVVPMFHATAWAHPYAAYWFGADLVLPSRHVDAVSLLDLVVTERVTFANGVPTIWNGVLGELRTGAVERDISCLERIVVGGAALPPALLDGFAERGVSVVQGWGMTETSPLITASRPARDAGPDRRRGQQLSQGRLLAGVELRLSHPESGVPVAADGRSVGEIELRGPWVTTSYLGGAGEEAFRDGWLRTGDIGTVDPDGFVRLTDRSKDVIKSGGEWISSVELENCLLGHPDLLDAAVIGVPDERWDERPCAVVVPRAGVEVDVEALRTWLVERVTKWWVPERWSVVEVIARTSVGKIDKRALRQQYEAGQLPLRRPPTS